jgi:ring-1,2-phenylacetyl-CoA epoxidase subunit PaaD
VVTADGAARPGAVARPDEVMRPGGAAGPGEVARPDDAVSAAARAGEIAASVPDPELPMLTLADLGILREVRADGERVIVSLTPTYSGCPAMAEMRADITRRLAGAGIEAEVRTVLRPAWSSDWITAEGRRKLAAAGLAPPNPAPRRAAGPVPVALTAVRREVTCPRCGAPGAVQTAAFSGTACKALYRCAACGEPFEYIKEI